MSESVQKKFPFEFLVWEAASFGILLDCLALNDVNLITLQESLEHCYYHSDELKFDFHILLKTQIVEVE